MRINRSVEFLYKCPIRPRWTDRISRAVALIYILFMASSATAAVGLNDLDPLLSQKTIPVTPAGNALDSIDNPCGPKPLPDRVDLLYSVERALCRNPKTLQAWAGIKVQAAQYGLGKGTFLPKLEGSIQWNHDRVITDVHDIPTLSTNFYNRFRQDALNLSWVLFDFGARSASVENAWQILVAAEETHVATLQTVFLTTAKDFYSSLAAQASVDSTREIEDAARQSLNAARARVEGGVAAVSDQLQAQTAYARSVYGRARAEGNLRTSLGLLALDMGLPPNMSLRLAEQDDRHLQAPSFVKRVDELLEEAKLSHPAISAAQAQLAAAQARKRAAIANSLPTISLSARASRNDQPLSPAFGQPELQVVTRDRFLGLQLNLPFFEGFSDLYKVKGAEAQVEAQQDNLLDVEQQVAQGVWVSYQTYVTNTENLNNTEVILESARQQFTAAQQRYQRGAASILELIAAQSSLADALQQRIQALNDWRTIRLQLAASIGKLGVSAIQ